MLKKPDKKQLGWLSFFLIGSLVPLFALMLRRPSGPREDAFIKDSSDAPAPGPGPASASASASASAPASASASAPK
jgi:hypothetical protein